MQTFGLDDLKFVIWRFFITTIPLGEGERKERSRDYGKNEWKKFMSMRTGKQVKNDAVGLKGNLKVLPILLLRLFSCLRYT